ncbi:MAG: hypothetical protein A3F18_06015 [Legionellales bacterium RIFCSPHIGHO2_12_FULL_37_14]|nr:MAG: hypothetical protein A3F18_06015 [Legionellales bacterium RIFCSPHIGHO2_12_FULL_37_14]
MKDSLLEKLIELFSDRLLKRTEATNNTALNHSKANIANWGDLEHIETNTYFIKESQERSNRILCLQEKIKLTSRSRRFLAQLRCIDIIGERTFELILNQLLFSSSEFVTLNETKWIILQTLESSLNENQLALLNLILYQKEDGITQH